MQTLADDNYIDLFYYDESHFGLTPVVAYAWQEKTSPILLPTQKGKYLTIAGFYSKNNTLVSYQFETTINTNTIIGIFNDFALKTTKKTVVIIDNAPIHKSKTFMAQIQRWRDENDLYLYFLPTYSPELNIIEILWRKIKYEWIEFSAYKSFNHLKGILNFIIQNIGVKFNIHFV